MASEEKKQEEKKQDQAVEEAVVESKISPKIMVPFMLCFACACMLFFGQLMANSNFGKMVSGLGVEVAVLGLVASCYSYTAILMRFIAGPAMDSFPRKRILLIGLALYALAFLGYAFGAGNGILWIVVVMRVFQGFGMGICSSAVQTLASDLLPKKAMGTGLGIFSMANSIATALAPGLGLLIQSYFGGYFAMYITCAFLMVGAIIITLCIKEPTREYRKFQFKKVSDIFATECLLAMFMQFFLQIVYYNQTTYLMIYAEEANAALAVTIGLYFTVHSGVCFFSRPLFGTLTDKWGTIKILMFGMTCMFICFWTISFATELWQFLIAAVLGGFGYQPCKTVIQTLSIKLAGGADRRGVAMSSAYLSQDAGNLVGPIVAGFIVSAMSFQVMWRVMTLGIVISFLITMCFRKRINAVDEAFRGVSLKKKK